MREIELLKKLDHPFIISMKEHFEYEGKQCMVMELADGIDLSKYLESSKSKQPEIANIFCGLLLGLYQIHS